MTITMKTKLITAIMILAAGIFSCDDDETIQDPIYEFISFGGDAEVNLGEATNNDAGYPLVVQLWAFEPYTQDITVNLGIGAINAKKDEDFTVTPSDVVKIPAGRLTSDTIWVKTINNDDANELERTFDISIHSTSLPDANIGLGITEPKKGLIKFKIQDDECSGNPICTFNQELANVVSAPDDSWSEDHTAVSVVDKNNSTVTVTGNLIAYGTFPAATLTLTMTPTSDGSSVGTATFGEQETGEDNDGYAYKFIEVGTGSYDASAGTIKVEYDIYYWDGDWYYWYSVVNNFSLP
jgi:hypothetical protein